MRSESRIQGNGLDCVVNSETTPRADAEKGGGMVTKRSSTGGGPGKESPSDKVEDPKMVATSVSEEAEEQMDNIDEPGEKAGCGEREQPTKARFHMT
jgi:hypothetical protein